ncbi:MAG: carboxypeptidase regulatory-like domain-containing protein, partial [Acidimicrobiales bacterium]|nr:carboxypeptidase regulatory-like domain-containing protein [Acidimicrobiales bacterium]
DLSGDDALAVSDGVVYVSQFQAGVRVFDNGLGSALGPEQGMTSIEVKDITVDSDGRVWFATQAGLTVLDGDDLVGYRMDNSDLSDNRTHLVATAGPGVALPEPQEEPLAGMAGVFLDATGSPLVGAPVEICLDAIDDNRTTPCTGQAVVFETTTDSSGRFEFTEVPAGRYSLGVQRPTGRWTYFVDGVISNNYEATQDQINELGAFSLSAEEEAEDG